MPMSSTCARWIENERVARDRAPDPLNPARGILIGCLIGAGLWAGIIALAVA